MKPTAKAVMDAINLKIADEGGELVRARTTGDGRTQYWVVRGQAGSDSGRTVVANTIYELAQGLGISLERDVKARPKKIDMKGVITVQRAGFLTGYSPATISKAIVDGYLKTADGVKPRRGRHTLVRRQEVIDWAHERMAGSGLRNPRKKGYKRSSGPLANGHPRTKAMKPDSRMTPMLIQNSHGNASERLTRYLEKLKGTPFEMTKEEFIQKVVDQALKRLNG